MGTVGQQRLRALSTWGVAALVIAVAAMMIVPLPTVVVDVLITANLAASVLMLLSAAFAESALSVASFPTVVVLLTLLRLGLNVSTVRLILLQADAGQVVRAFGAVVVRGDYVVGAAVFLVLTIVQYVVIARGAERVAEVGARFALDAMPGQQLAIDADLRAGAIDAGEAGRRRDAQNREAQLLGALDGAMRFVKGDAIAGMLILGVSLVGGLLIGVAQKGMGIGEAARLYTLLTIGDGLASQIPALLVSTAAGLVVTRTPSAAGAAGGGGADLLALAAERPGLLGGASALLFALALVPGMPALPFAIVGGVLALALLLLWRRRAPSAGTKGSRLAPVPAAIEVRVSPSLALERLAAEVAALVERLVDELGIPLPAPVLRRDARLEAGRYRLVVHGLLGAEGGGAAGPDTTASEAHGRMLQEIEAALRRATPRLLGTDDVERLLSVLSARAPALVRETVPRRIELPLLVQALRLLLAEDLPIGDLREILEALATERDLPRDPVLLGERLRLALAPRISARYAEAGLLRALVLCDDAEEALRGGLRTHAAAPGGLELALEPALAEELVAGARVAVAGARAAGARAVVVCAPELRRHLYRLLDEEVEAVTVLSFRELLPSVEIDTLGVIELGGAAALTVADPDRPDGEDLEAPMARQTVRASATGDW